MDRARVHEGIRRMRFGALLERQEEGSLSQVEAAEMLGMSERSFRRWRDRLREEGEAGLADRRLGKPSSRRAASEEISRMLGLYRERYADFTVKHFHEQLLKRHGYKLGYTVTKVHLQRAGLVRRAAKRSAHRKKRSRRPMIGIMLHQDASRHAWLRGRQDDMVVTLDDATSAIYSAFLLVYALAMIPGGFVIDRFGARAALLISPYNGFRTWGTTLMTAEIPVGWQTGETPTVPAGHLRVPRRGCPTVLQPGPQHARTLDRRSRRREREIRDARRPTL